MNDKTFFTALGILWLAALVLTIATGGAVLTTLLLGFVTGCGFTVWRVVRHDRY